MLRRKKFLANINKWKIGLAEQPLFEQDFTFAASKQAELSGGLAKNLSNTLKPKQTDLKHVHFKDRQRSWYSGTFTKYQGFR